MHLVVFEHRDWPSLAPLTFSRPTFALICGMGTLLEKQLRFLRPTRLTLWVRPEMADHCRGAVLPSVRATELTRAIAINEPLDDEPAMLVDGSTLYLPEYSPPQGAADTDFVAVDGPAHRICQARVRAPGLSPFDAIEHSPRWNALLDLPRAAPAGRNITHVWDLLGFNDAALLADAAEREQRLKSRGITARSQGTCHLINGENVFVEAGVTLSAGCVVDASKGPIVLAKDSLIGANAVVQGPCFIGAHAEISPLALIRPGTSIGPYCKIGGEVARTLIIGYSNKAHEGYLGDSYIGEWVNLGAGTTTSNLKNTYGTIGIRAGAGEKSREIDTSRKFLGSLIGDHTKTAIGTRFMSGSYVGCCAMIATSSHAPRFTSSFSFSTDRGTEDYRLAKAFEVARAMFARRNRGWTAEDENLMRYAAGAAREIESG
jgi:UDP-N-acetylglucosamine diphosphorylase/glucosamine-1-phosphate N-acetyltransferase